MIAYNNSIKVNILGIPKLLIKNKGAVSKEVALKMADQIRKKFNSSIGIATTGISGPSGGSDDKPVGLIYIAITTDSKKIASSGEKYGAEVPFLRP